MTDRAYHERWALSADVTTTPTSTQEEFVMATTQDVLNRHLGSFGKRDLAGILSDYAPGAVLFTPDGPLRGVDEIRPFFQSLIAEFEQPDSSFRLTHQSIEGNHAYILWSAETADNVYELGADMFVVRDGKIVAQSFAGKILPKAGLEGKGRTRSAKAD
jgi:ketosteroid isomerase-like protein